jgi:hypothetical protein
MALPAEILLSGAQGLKLKATKVDVRHGPRGSALFRLSNSVAGGQQPISCP